MKKAALLAALCLPIILAAQVPTGVKPKHPSERLSLTQQEMMALNANREQFTPELLWELGRLSVVSPSPDQTRLLYSVAKTDLVTEKIEKKYFLLDVSSKHIQAADLLGDKSFVQWDKNGLYARKGNQLFLSEDEGKSWKVRSTVLQDAKDVKVSPDGKYLAFSKEVKVETILGKEKYPELTKTTARIYTDLDIRHWDAWNVGTVNHVFVANLEDPNDAGVDVLEGKPFSCPQKPFGGSEDFIFSADSRSILYVTKEKTGKDYAQSTNTDIFLYSIQDKETKNLTEGRLGYDVQPQLSPDGKRMAWLSMANDGYEADKNDLIVMDLETGYARNLTAAWDETVDGSFRWANSGKSLDFTASYRGTKVLFTVPVPANLMDRSIPVIEPLLQGEFDINSIVLETKDGYVLSRNDFHHAPELFYFQEKRKTLEPLTHINSSLYEKVKMGHSELKMVQTNDGKEMGVWVVYPPDFDPTKKYPTLLYCQGGPQSALTQFYSYRWNLQLMAANGYIVVAPNRRGMPGWGVEWNASISKDWGGAVMKDYLAAIDALAAEPYVDENRLGCVGASYGGYSAFMLAGIHENRFKTFIAHDGLFDMKSWYGTTEELFFANWDLGGNYWQTPTPEAYTTFNPSNYVNKWNTPIFIIQGEMDFRVPVEQGIQAFQAAQLKGIKSKLLFLPNENHWVLHPHNALVWQKEFFSWLRETL